MKRERSGNERGEYYEEGKETKAGGSICRRLKKDFIRYRYIYLMLLPVVIYYAVFCYGPMSKIVIAFQNFKPALGISGSKWVGMKYFIDFFHRAVRVETDPEYAASEYIADYSGLSGADYPGASYYEIQCALQEAGANGQLYASLHIACRHVQPALDVQPFGWNL